MKFDQRWILTVVAIGCLPLASCRKMEAETEEAEQSAATVVHQEDKNPDQPTIITLTEDARKRIDIQTAPVQQADVNGTMQTVLPFAAIFYSPDGETWTYINSQPLTYVRQRIKVDRIVNDNVIMANGPAPGTQVVTIGASLLYGSETDFEED
jgi:hypothetical protein